jgi:MFS family permease
VTDPGPPRGRSFLLGVFLTALSTLALEILDTRLLSVLTWYHISFFAVSMAMFGMTAGAVHVYLGGDRFRGDNALRELARHGRWYAIAIALTHIVSLCIPIHVTPSVSFVLSMLLQSVVLATPFFLSGVVIALALTRVPGRIGQIYGTDLVGAALGALVVIPLLAWSNISSAALVVAGLAALGSAAFDHFTGVRPVKGAVLLFLALVGIAIANAYTMYGLRVTFAKGEPQEARRLEFEGWNIHSQVVASRAIRDRPFYWAPGELALRDKDQRISWLKIDGAAGTAMTKWSGDVTDLAWVSHDVTALPYHLRKGGEVGVIGVGGGRDILTAIWAESASVTGIELNQLFLDLLRKKMRRFARIAGRPDVRLVHDEARSWLTRNPRQFDVLQMSLIDTWAATGAGAFTLSENGLYTIEAWRVFLGSLAPDGLFSVSRWYDPERASETGRLVALATASLLDLGAERPADHLALVARDRLATLLVSPSPLSASDLEAVKAVAGPEGFTILLLPGEAPGSPLLGAIASSPSRAALLATVADEPLDYTPPTDQRPYFFNLVKPGRVLAGLGEWSGGTTALGNLLATAMLLLLCGITFVLAFATIYVPLARRGRPAIAVVPFRIAVAYFGCLGAGYMMVQIPLMQRFSVYLGHPTWSVAIVLFSMILATGLGSLASDRVPQQALPVAVLAIPLAIAGALVGAVALLGPVTQATVAYDLGVRCAVVAAFTMPVAFLLGFCFPIGMRLVGQLSDEAMPWMWGINGALGVFASVVVVAVSMWAGIDVSLMAAAGLYGGVAILGRSLAAHATEPQRAWEPVTP